MTVDGSANAVYGLNSIIQIGYKGENEARTIAIDIRPLIREWPELAPVLVARRPGEKEAYPCSTTIRDGILLWQITSGDTAIAGSGQCCIHMIDSEGRVGKSRTMTTIIRDSLSADEGSAPPEAIKPWIDEVLAAAQEIRAGYVPIDQGAENAGRLLYVRADGKLAPLTLGDGLEIADGVLRVTGTITPETQIVFEDAGDGIVQMSGAAFSDQGSGVVLVSGAAFSDQGGGTVLIH